MEKKDRYKILFILLGFLLSASSCKKEREKPLELNCEILEAIQQSDQKLRSTGLMPPFFLILDSLLLASGESGLDELSIVDSEKKDSLWALAKELERPFTFVEKQKQDSLWQIQINIDSLNVLKIISFINQFGIDSLNHVDQKCGINSLLVFVHTPDVLFQDVRDVVLKNSQGIGENRMRHIMWHLDGRERRNK